MKSKFYILPLLTFLIVLSAGTSIAAPAITLSTPTIAAANSNQGTGSLIVYAVKMKVANADVTINNIQLMLGGNYDNNDISNITIYYNATAVSVSGASYLTSTSSVAFGAPHTYSLGIYKPLVAGDEGYFIIAVNLSASATDGHYISINGATNPVVFGYSVASNVTNSQSNKAGKQTIQGADITLSTVSTASTTVNQGTNSVIVYASKMKVLTEPVTVNNIQFTIDGNIDNNDISSITVYYNPTAATITGASYLTSTSSVAYAAPHVYSFGIYKPLVVGDAGYFIVAVNISVTASDNKYIKIKGDTEPATFGFTTAPNVTDNQSNLAGKETIQAADITLSTASTAATNVNQGTNSVIVYASKMKVLTEPVTVNNIQFTIDGNIDNNDISSITVYYNPTAATITGASYLTSTSSVAYAAPHVYSFGIYKPLVVGDAGYFIVAVNISVTASDNKYIKIKGDTEPATFGFTTAPNVTDNQSNLAGKETIQAADITLSTASTAATNVNQGTNSVIVYASKMKVLTEPVTVNNIQFTIDGNIDNNDISSITVYYNPTAATITGASYLTSTSSVAYAAPHVYSLGIYKPLVAGDAGYFIVAVNISATASDNKYIKINGDTEPATFGFTTAPNVTDNQSNLAGKETIQAADITLTTASTPAGNMVKGSSSNIIYAAKMKVLTEPVTVNNIQFTLSGTYDVNDLTSLTVYYNPTAATISGASYLTSTSSVAYAAPHTYSLGIYKPLVVGDAGYFIVAVNVSATGTSGHTVKENGSTDPASFGFTTLPNITNSQSNNAGTRTISSSAKSANENEENIIADKSLISLNRIFPNPANASFNFSLNGNKNENIKAQLTGRSGNILIEKNITINKGMNQFTMNVSSFLSGVYYLVITNGESEIISKQQIIIQH